MSIWNTGSKQMWACWQNLFTHAVIFQAKTQWGPPPGLTLTLLPCAIHPNMTLTHYQLQPVMLLSGCSAPGHRLDITKRVHIQSSTSLTGDAAWPSIWDRLTKTNSSHVKASCGNVGYRCGPPSLSPLRTVAGPDKTLLRVKALILAAGELIGSPQLNQT